MDAGTDAALEGVILDDGTSGAVYGEPDLTSFAGQTLVVYVKDQPQASLPGKPTYARPFVQVLSAGAHFAHPSVPIDFSAVTVQNAATVYDANGDAVSNPPAPAAEFERHVDATVWYPLALGDGNVGVLLSAEEPRIDEDMANGFCDPVALETGPATSTLCATSPTWKEADFLAGPGWGLFQNLWFVEVEVSVAAGAVSQATAVKATRLTYVTTFPKTTVTPPLFQGAYDPHFDPSGTLAAWTQARAFGTGGSLGNLGTYVVMAASFAWNGGSPSLSHLATGALGSGSPSGYSCTATRLNNYQELHGFFGEQSLIVAGNMNGQNEDDQDLGLAPLTLAGGVLSSVGPPAVVGTAAYNEGNWSEGSAWIPKGPYAGRIVATSNKAPDGSTLYTGSRMFPCAGAGGITDVEVDYQIVGGSGPPVQVTNFNGLVQAGGALVGNATLATTGISAAAGAAVAEVAVDGSGSFLVGELILRNAALTVVGTQLWYLPLQ
jgi:hypothetical protein